MSANDSWIAEALDRLLPPKLRENTDMYNKTFEALRAAKVGSEAELLDMTKDQLKAANVPVGARCYLRQERLAKQTAITTTPETPSHEHLLNSSSAQKAAILASIIKSLRLDSPDEPGEAAAIFAESNIEQTGGVLVSCGGEELHALVRAGNLGAIEMLHDSSSAVKWERALCAIDEQHNTPLSLAIRLGNLQVVTKLLELGAARSVFVVHAFGLDELVCTLPATMTPTARVLEYDAPEQCKALAIVDQALQRYIADLAAGCVTFAGRLPQHDSKPVGDAEGTRGDNEKITPEVEALFDPNRCGNRGTLDAECKRVSFRGTGTVLLTCPLPTDGVHVMEFEVHGSEQCLVGIAAPDVDVDEYLGEAKGAIRQYCYVC